MRCTNCGWENAQGNTKCIKCNTTLAAPAPVKSTASTARNDGFTGTLKDEEYTDETVGKNNNSSANNDGVLHKCSVCGFPNLIGATVCSHCGSELNLKSNKTDEQPVKGTIPPVQPDSCGATGTIDPYKMKAAKEHFCHLQIVRKEGEESQIDELEDVTLEFSDQDGPVKLNRDMLDPNNITITSKVQAELTYIDGQWFLKDRSALQTTFVRVSENTALKEGDVILMGDRRFIFSAQNPE